MKFNKLISEIKGELEKGDQITLPGSVDVWTVEDEDTEYFTISNNDSGEETRISKFNLGSVKKFPILEFKTQEDKDKEVARYKEKIKEIKSKMRTFKANSKKSDKYKALVRDLERTQAALDLAQRKTPYMSVY